MHRSFKFLLRPTHRQTAALATCLEDHRVLYNAALTERREAYQRRTISIRYTDQSSQLREIRGADPEGQGRWSAGSQQQTLRRLDRAFQGFFRRVRSGVRPGFPRFKGRGRFNTVEWPALKNGARWNSTPNEPVTRVYLIGIGHIRVHPHRAVLGNVKTIAVKRERSRWYVILRCDDIPAEPLPKSEAMAGIDMGVASFLTDSDGGHVRNPRYARATAGRLAAAQREVSRCGPGSRRRRNARARVAALHGKIRRQRLDHAHKIALALVRTYDLIAHEDLRIANMTRSASGTLDSPGTNVAQKTGLNRSILDAGWGLFLRILTYKAESAGRVLIAVNPAGTSRTCWACGHRAGGNRVSQAEFRCRACGHTAHADVNAARNILRAGLALRAA
ncbi:MAG TPA: transposase [Streptosporangiaceae bacterium]